MPAEWELHKGVWIAWPHLKKHWPGYFEPIPIVYSRIIGALQRSEEVFVMVKNDSMEREVRQILGQEKVPSDKVTFYHFPTNSSWVRDYGPIFVQSENGPVITHWVFNAWGDQWEHDKDNQIPRLISNKIGVPIVETNMVLEGGSIDVNGKGTLITTEQCLLNKNRNPHLNRKQIEENLEKYLGVHHIIWLKNGVEGDDTSGHVDDLTRFTGERTVVTCLETDKNDENYQALKSNYEILEKSVDQDGKSLDVIALPMPSPVVREGQRLPASYANFFIGNKIVLVPIFKCKSDDTALALLQKCFPNREIVGIDCTDLVWGLGTFHCSTQQQPMF
jgi:agmatine deiminase